MYTTGSFCMDDTLASHENPDAVRVSLKIYASLRKRLIDQIKDDLIPTKTHYTACTLAFKKSNKRLALRLLNTLFGQTA